MIILQDFVPYRLNRLAAEMSMQTRAVYLDSYDLTVPEWRVLATLAERQEQTARAIGLQTYMHKTKVSRAVRSLEHRRWLRRNRNELDRREELLSLNDKGLAEYAIIARRMTKFQQSIFTKLGHKRDELMPMIEALERVLRIEKRRSPAIKHRGYPR